MFGLAEAALDDLDKLEAEEYLVWPDNWPTVAVFMAMQTQWRCGPAGVIGLDYNVLPEMWRRCKVPLADRDSVFRDLQVMEDAALAELRRPAAK